MFTTHRRLDEGIPSPTGNRRRQLGLNPRESQQNSVHQPGRGEGCTRTPIRVVKGLRER